VAPSHLPASALNRIKPKGQRQPCNHSQVLDLVKLRVRFGPDAPAMEWNLKPKLKCAVHGGRKVGLIYTPDTSPNAYGKAKAGRWMTQPISRLK
jgi:hypothetical protein